MIEHQTLHAIETDRRDCSVVIEREREMLANRVEPGWLNVQVCTGSHIGFKFCGETDLSDSVDVLVTDEEAVQIANWILTSVDNRKRGLL